MKAVIRYLPFAVLPFAVLAESSLAATKYEETKQATFMFEFDKGSDFQKWGVGLGSRPADESLGFGGLYYQNLSLKKSDLDVQSFGVRGFKAKPNSDSDLGVDLFVALSHTERDSYKRTGFSGRAAFYIPVWESLTVLVGAELRPKFFAIDWGSSVLSETGFDAGVDWRFTENLGVYTHYYYQGAVDNDFATHKFGSGVAAGINWIW